MKNKNNNQNEFERLGGQKSGGGGYIPPIPPLDPPLPMSCFFWPIKEDTCYIPNNDVICKISAPVSSSNAARTYKISSQIQLFEMELERHDFRAIIFYDYMRDLSASQSHIQLESVFGDKAPSHGTIFNWSVEFRRGRS